MDEKCDKCGKSKVGKLVNRRLGADEASVFIVCKCSENEEEETKFMESEFERCRTIGKNIILSSLRLVEQSPSQSMALSQLGRAHIETEIRLSRTVSRSCFESLKGERETRWKEEGFSLTLEDDSTQGQIKHCSSRVRIRTLEEDSIKTEVSRLEVCPGTRLVTSKEYRLSEETKRKLYLSSQSPVSTYKEEIVSRFLQFDDWTVRANFYVLSNTFSCEVEYNGEEPEENDVLNALVYVHSMLGYIGECRVLFESRLLDACRRTISNVVDVSRPPEGNLKFKIKADGETAWVIDGGSFWYICRPNRQLTVTGWVPKDFLQEPTNNPDLLRVEQLLDGRLVLIDVPIRNGSITSSTKRYSTGSASFVNGVIRGLVVRKEFESLEEAAKERTTSDIPSDGIIAIDLTDSMTYRIKEPTLDMIADSNGVLRTMKSEATGEIMNTGALSRLKEGAVYECTLGMDDTKESVTVKRIMRRLDKIVPNSFETALDILQRITDDRLSEQSISRKISVLSFLIRERVYELASNLSGGRGLIVDVGSGRLQSWSVIAGMRQKFLFCDPNFRLPRGRGAIRESFFDITELSLKDKKTALLRASSYKSTNKKYLCFRGKIEDLLNEPSLMNVLKTNKATFVYSFSLSYLKDTINILDSLDVTQVGCGFLYDNVESDGSLFQVPGHSIKCKGKDHTRAIVDFYKVQRFEEDVVKRKDFVGSFKWYSAKDIIPKDNLGVSRDLNEVVRNIWIFARTM